MSSTRGGAGQPDLNLYRNSLKAYVYLLSWFLQDNSKLKESKDPNAATKARNKKPGNQGSAMKKKGGEDQTANAAQVLNEIKMLQIQTLKHF